MMTTKVWLLESYIEVWQTARLSDLRIPQVQGTHRARWLAKLAGLRNLWV